MSEWIKWNGEGTCPVDKTTLIEWWSAQKNMYLGERRAKAHAWNLAGYYRIVEEKQDNVNTPSHYSSGNLECIDAIREMLTKEQFKGMLAGNVTKYLWRKDYKGHPLTDLRKARWYLNRLIEEYENDNGN